jgi:hypothetical protein
MMDESNGSEGELATASLRRLRVVAEADPGALARVLARFVNLNVMPRRVIAELGSPDKMYIQVDVCGLPERSVALIADKVRQDVHVINAYWHPL